MDKIDLAIQRIMSSVFNVPLEDVTNKSSQDSIDSWDSLRHLNLIVGLEEEFDVIIPIEEVGNMISFELIKIIVSDLLASENKTY